MNREESMKEKLSALADNELDELEERRVLAALARDAELRRTWERYHLVRAALRQDLEVVVAHDTAEQVARKIEREPSAATSRRRAQFIRVAGTLALAASVAAIAIIGVQRFHVLAAAPKQLAVRTSAPQDVASVSGMRWDTKHPEAESALNAYLVEHNEFASASGLGGMMPYVRVVGYDNDK